MSSLTGLFDTGMTFFYKYIVPNGTLTW